MFKPKIINNVHTSSDSMHRPDIMLSLATKVEEHDEQGDATEMTAMNVFTGSKMTTTGSRGFAAGKRRANQNDWPINPLLGQLPNGSRCSIHIVVQGCKPHNANCSQTHERHYAPAVLRTVRGFKQ